jgi:hypothetical protein
MTLKNEISYYGHLSKMAPVRNFSDDLLIEGKKRMLQELKEMEERIKRHITECKREVIRKLSSGNTKNLTKEVKELKNGSKNK